MENSINEGEKTPSRRGSEPSLEILNEIRLGVFKKDEDVKEEEVSADDIRISDCRLLDTELILKQVDFKEKEQVSIKLNLFAPSPEEEGQHKENESNQNQIKLPKISSPTAKSPAGGGGGEGLQKENTDSHVKFFKINSPSAKSPAGGWVGVGPENSSRKRTQKHSSIRNTAIGARNSKKHETKLEEEIGGVEKEDIENLNLELFQRGFDSHKLFTRYFPNNNIDLLMAKIKRNYDRKIKALYRTHSPKGKGRKTKNNWDDI
jgi:hypothetical protein